MCVVKFLEFRFSISAHFTCHLNLIFFDISISLKLIRDVKCNSIIK